MTPGKIDDIAARYAGMTVNQAFADSQRLLVHEEPLENVATYRLHINKPVAGVGGKMPRWRIEISVQLENGMAMTLNDGKATAPWTALQEIVAESLKVMAIYVEEGRGQMIAARRSGVRAV